MVTRVGLVVLCLVGTLLAASAASAQQGSGVSVSVEGQWGYRLTPNMQPFGYWPVFPPNVSGILTGVVPDLANRTVGAGRLELGVTGENASGGFIRLDATVSGWLGINSLHAESWGDYYCAWEETGAYACRGFLCKFDATEPCRLDDARLAEAYREVMPGLFVGHGLGQSASIAVGIEPFAGRFTLQSDAGTHALDNGTGFDFVDDLTGRVVGVLGAAELDLPLSRRVGLSLSGGGGVYRFNVAADTTTVQSITPGTVTTREFAGAETLTGWRAQAAIGLSVAVSDRIELGLITRADYWSAFPRMSWLSTSVQTCQRAVSGNDTLTFCQSPPAVGVHGLTASPLLLLSGGLRLTVHFGG